MSNDQFGRNIDYLRISVTDRCNYRCRYCMPEEGIKLLAHDKMLTFEDIEFFVKIAAEHGIKNIRLTGGEPLVRPKFPDLVAKIRAIDGIEDISITTNGALLPKFAPALKEAGLNRVNISLDTLDEETFHYITRCGHLSEALASIDTAIEYGFTPVKINTVVVRSLKQNLIDYAKLAVDRPLSIRFIEYMPVGDSAGFEGDGWTLDDTIPSAELIEQIRKEGKEAGLGELVALEKGAVYGHGPASYYKFENSVGTIGFINALSNHFCSSCNRLRLTSEGALRPCLFSDHEYDLREAIRARDVEKTTEGFMQALKTKPQSHQDRVGTNRMMSQIGG
ncbi:MAG: GTP 3',8-cyclase MoaA [Coriobacteriia bacterium]|nr:GTP 3',8-cyclase MoaA [Coriobacteriia bacterium]